MTSEISTDVPRSDVAVDAPNGRNNPPIVLETPHIDVLRSSDIEVPAIIQPACMPRGSCEKSSRKYVYKYMNEYLDLPGILNIWDGKVAYYDSNAFSVFHGGAWDMDEHTKIVQFNYEGNEDWLGSVMFHRTVRAGYWHGYDHAGREITMQLIAEYIFCARCRKWILDA